MLFDSGMIALGAVLVDLLVGKIVGDVAYALLQAPTVAPGGAGS